MTDDEEDEENNIPASNTQKRHAPRKCRSSSFVLKDLEFSDKASGVNEKFKIGGNIPLTIFDNELMQKIVEETNNYQQQIAAPNVENTAAWYNTNAEELYIFFSPLQF